MFIVIEGIDGGGKSTAALRLAEARQPANNYFKFPSLNSEAGRLVREIFGGTKQIEDRRAMIYLITADAICRMDDLRRASRSGMAIADRYSLSSGWVYQTSEGWGIDDLYDIVKPELFLIPDMTFIIDIPAGVATHRINTRAAAKGGVPVNTMYEERLEMKREKYLAYAKMEPFGPCHVVDGRGTQDEVYNAIVDRLVGAGLWA